MHIISDNALFYKVLSVAGMLCGNKTQRKKYEQKKNSLTRSFKTDVDVLFSMFYFLTRGCFSDARADKKYNRYFQALEIDPQFILLDTNRKSYMAKSAVLLDVTLNDLEGQNPYPEHFSTQPPQKRVQLQQIIIDDFQICKRTSLAYRTC